MRIFFFVTVSVFFYLQQGYSQKITLLDSSQPKVSFRGIATFGTNNIWVSGSQGAVGKSTDGGRHFLWVSPKGYENRDFRDIEVLSEETALVMAVDSPAIILRTEDGGQFWKEVYRKDAAGMFLDAFDFKNKKEGLAVGDPVDGAFFFISTKDGGRSWQEIPLANRLVPSTGDAIFAASGTNLQLFSHKKQGNLGYLVIGGPSSWLINIRGQIHKPQFVRSRRLALFGGTQTSGANGISTLNRQLLIVGGDFLNPQKVDSTGILIAKNLMYTLNLGGYRSAGVLCPDHRILACGPLGVYLSDPIEPNDYGKKQTQNFKQPIGFHCIALVRGQKQAYLAGPGGRIAKINW